VTGTSVGKGEQWLGSAPVTSAPAALTTMRTTTGAPDHARDTRERARCGLEGLSSGFHARRFSVVRTGNVPRGRDGYVSASTRGHQIDAPREAELPLSAVQLAGTSSIYSNANADSDAIDWSRAAIDFTPFVT
jgi:hypothetical protein